MMEKFEDYYSILGISQTGDVDQIKKAFKSKLREWHPDLNKSDNANEMTQRIIVAFKILNDTEARILYYHEYHKNVKNGRTCDSAENWNSNRNNSYEDAEISDEKLKRWIRRATADAINEIKNIKLDFVEASSVAVNGAINYGKIAIIYTLILFVIFSILAVIVKN